jgi:predicted metal-dependent hydrolase
MTTSGRRITVSGLAVEVVRKDIKNLHLGVYPPAGRVRVAAPLALSDDAVRLAVIDRLGWIKRQKRLFAKQPRQSPREMVSGESHYFMGRRYRLRVHETDGAARVAIRGLRMIDLFVRPGTTTEQRETVLLNWYRAELKALIPPLLEKWQPVLRVKVRDWGVKKMKTKWGTCSVDARRIWINLELAKKPLRCLEYIVVHEMVHLLERKHGDRFTALMDRYLPDWPSRRTELQQSVLGSEHWSY